MCATVFLNLSASIRDVKRANAARRNDPEIRTLAFRVGAIRTQNRFGFARVASRVELVELPAEPGVVGGQSR